ncbi:hypothetical protein SADUNF_SadunfMtG0009700 (mitochondrion) [Salix dunnii]|uniref:Uncharacterized protein n=1 Tax=Salix dunnii TaxID=1413687 RepID=A0A835J085_9ROSI|nr:hypothetical protein SADUNF_SadunfMtG0009700 [Salix dunnii]
MVMELSQPVFDSRIDSSSTSGIDELEEQAERETRDRGNEFHCHPLLQLSARLPDCLLPIEERLRIHALTGPLASDRALESVPVDDPQSQGPCKDGTSLANKHRTQVLNAALAATRRSSTASRASSEEALLYKLHPHNIGSLTRRSNYLRRPIVEAISHRKGSSRLKHHLGLPGILKHQVRGNYRTERGVGWFAYAIPLPLAGLEPSHTDNEIDLALVPGLPPTLEPTALACAISLACFTLLLLLALALPRRPTADSQAADSGHGDPISDSPVPRKR